MKKGETKLIVSYSKLWKLLIDRKIKKTELKKAVQLSSSTYSKLNKDEYVSMDIIARICGYLNCDVGDVMEFLSEDSNEV